MVSMIYHFKSGQKTEKIGAENYNSFVLFFLPSLDRLEPRGYIRSFELGVGPQVLDLGRSRDTKEGSEAPVQT